MTAWKRNELRAARLLGGERAGPQGRQGSDGRNLAVPVALECKRQKKYQLRGADLAQARRQGTQEGLPWVLQLAQHNDRSPLAVCDWKWLAGRLRRLAELERVLFPDDT